MATYFTREFVNQVASFLSKYVGLIKIDGSEVLGGDYVRQAVNFALQSEDENYYYLANTNEIKFPVASAPYGVVAGVGIYSAQTGGDLWIRADLDQAKQVYSNDQVIFQAGAIRVRIPKTI